MEVGVAVADDSSFVVSRMAAAALGWTNAVDGRANIATSEDSICSPFIVALVKRRRKRELLEPEQWWK